MALTNLRVRLPRSMVGSCVVQKHTESMLQLLNLVCAVCTWKSGRLNQIADVPVQQIEEERVEANQLVPQERTQQHITELNFIVWNGVRNLYPEKMHQA